MVHLSVWNRSQLLQLLAAALLGVLSGMVAAAFVYGHQVDRVTLENARLERELEDLQRDYERLQAGTDSPQRKVRALDLRFTDLRDERVRLQLDREIKELLAEHIIGKPVGELDPLLAADVVDGRSWAFENQEWRVAVRGSYFVWDTLILYLDVDMRPAPVAG